MAKDVLLTINWKESWKEFSIPYREDGTYREGKTYYTDSLQDAQATLANMVADLRRSGANVHVKENRWTRDWEDYLTTFELGIHEDPGSADPDDKYGLYISEEKPGDWVRYRDVHAFAGDSMEDFRSDDIEDAKQVLADAYDMITGDGYKVEVPNNWYTEGWRRYLR